MQFSVTAFARQTLHTLHSSTACVQSLLIASHEVTTDNNAFSIRWGEGQIPLLAYCNIDLFEPTKIS